VPTDVAASDALSVTVTDEFEPGDDVWYSGRLNFNLSHLSRVASANDARPAELFFKVKRAGLTRDILARVLHMLAVNCRGMNPNVVPLHVFTANLDVYVNRSFPFDTMDERQFDNLIRQRKPRDGKPSDSRRIRLAFFRLRQGFPDHRFSVSAPVSFPIGAILASPAPVPSHSPVDVPLGSVLLPPPGPPPPTLAGTKRPLSLIGFWVPAHRVTEVNSLVASFLDNCEREDTQTDKPEDFDTPNTIPFPSIPFH
jgi:hypothetical protein